MREKSAEITRLKNEVERLAGEVEVLRGVVEEGLRERRAAKEATLLSSQQDELMHHDLAEEDEEDEYQDEELESEAEDPGLSYASHGAMNRTLRTDRATEGTSGGIQTYETRAPGAQFLDSADYDRISAEINDRRSEYSASEDLSQFSQSPSPSPKSRRHRGKTDGDLSLVGRRAGSPDPLIDYEEEDEPGPSTRPRAATGFYPEVEEPFPKIRGQRLERMFFAAPEHDAKACSTCNRRRRESDEHPVSHAWRHRRAAARSRHGSDEDEGFAEGSENLNPHHQHHHGQPARGKRRERSIQDINQVPAVARQEGLPPQTIVARIIRELEDDFTHYKR